MAAGVLLTILVAVIVGRAAYTMASGEDESSRVEAANQALCRDLDVRGGTYYHQYVVKVMGGAPGYVSVTIDPAVLQRAIDDLERIGTSAPRLGGGTAASPELEQERATMVAAADALGVLYPNADGTALLTAFVGTSVECMKAGYSPTWFDIDALSNGTAGTEPAARPENQPGSDPNLASGSTSSTAMGGTFTAGVYEVGLEPGDIAPGAYKATCEHNGYWARLRTTDTGDIISNDWKPNGGPMIVTVKKGDTAVELGDCTWRKSE